MKGSRDCGVNRGIKVFIFREFGTYLLFKICFFDLNEKYFKILRCVLFMLKYIREELVKLFWGFLFLKRIFKI